MKYLVPSIGRCGSSLMWELLITATGCPPDQINDLKKIKHAPAQVIKTHDHYRATLDYNYRAVFMSGDIRSVIASLYAKNPHFICIHLKHIQVALPHRIVFGQLIRLAKIFRNDFFRERAFCYLVKNDKFLFKKNIESWKKSKNTIFINYNDLCQNQEKALRKISDHIGCSIDSFEVKQRTSNLSILPKSVLHLIESNYPQYSRPAM